MVLVSHLILKGEKSGRANTDSRRPRNSYHAGRKLGGRGAQTCRVGSQRLSKPSNSVRVRGRCERKRMGFPSSNPPGDLRAASCLKKEKKDLQTINPRLTKRPSLERKARWHSSTNADPTQPSVNKQIDLPSSRTGASVHGSLVRIVRGVAVGLLWASKHLSHHRGPRS